MSKKIRIQTTKNQSFPIFFIKIAHFFSKILLQKEDKTVLLAIINQNNQSKNKL